MNSMTERITALLICVGLLALPDTTLRAQNVTLVETGSTLIHPLFTVWAADYGKTHSGVTITATGTSSGE